MFVTSVHSHRERCSAIQSGEGIEKKQASTSRSCRSPRLNDHFAFTARAIRGSPKRDKSWSPLRDLLSDPTETSCNHHLCRRALDKTDPRMCEEKATRTSMCLSQNGLNMSFFLKQIFEKLHGSHQSWEKKQQLITDLITSYISMTFLFELIEFYDFLRF